MRRWISGLYPQLDADEQERTRSVAWFLTTFTIVLIFILISAILIAASSFRRPLSVPNFVTFMGLSLLIGAAGFAAGGFLGFLFGVPRVKTAEASGEEVTSNTNLEQLSDWLTKIIVGVSLVQIGKLNGALLAFGGEVDRAMGAASGGRPVVNGAGFAADLILVASAIAGFLAAYLKSKTDLMTAFAPRQAMESSLGKIIADDLIGQAGRDVLNRPTSEPDQCAKDAAAKLIQFVHPDSKDPELHRLVGLAQAVLKNFKAASDSLTKAVNLRAGGASGSPDLVALATRALAIAGDSQAARSMSERADNAATQAPAEAFERGLAEMFANLYSRGGHDTAIAIGEGLVANFKEAAQMSGRLWLYLASAYGQRHAFQKDDPTIDDEAREETHQKVLEAVRKALQIDPAANRPILQLLWDKNCKTKPPDENDLESLYEDNVLKDLLYPEPEPARGASTPAR
jgi:hypothetical protein